MNKVLCWKCDSILLAFWKLWVCFPTWAVASSSHHCRAISCTPLTLPHLAFLRMPPLYYTYTIPSVSVLMLFHLWSASLSSVFFPKMVSSILMSSIAADMLVIPKYIAPIPKFPQSLDLYFYYPLNISMDMSIWTQVMSPNKVCSSWIPVLVTITVYTGTPARNIYRLKFLLVSYQSAYHIFSTPTIFLEFGPFSPLYL